MVFFLSQCITENGSKSLKELHEIPRKIRYKKVTADVTVIAKLGAIIIACKRLLLIKVPVQDTIQKHDP